MDQRPAKTSKELANAVYDDWKRKVVDEAKKRAVGQHVDYDTFKNMVSVAHLKPIGAPNTAGSGVMLPSWNFGADGTLMKQQVEELRLPQTTPTEPPSTSGDFYRDWRRNCPSQDDKYRYLKLCGPAVLRSVFKVEVAVDVLRDVLAVLEACWLSHAGAAEDVDGGSALREAAFTMQLLQALTGAGRFSLTVRLLGSSSQPVLASLFGQLQAALDASKAAVEAGAAEGGAGQEQGEGGPPAAPSTHGMYTAEELSALAQQYGCKLPLSSS